VDRAARSRGTRAARGVAAAVVGVIFLLPLYAMVAGSLRPLGVPPPRTIDLLPWPVSLGSYAEVFRVVPMARFIRNSLLVAAVGVPVSVLVASWAGFAIARLPRRARVALIGISVIALLIPASALIVGRFTIYRTLGLTDTLVPLMAPSLLGTSPLFVLVFAWSFARIEPQLYDIAREAGLSPVQTWWRVAMPLTRPITGAVALLAFVLMWSNFVDPLVYVFDEDLYTVPIGMRSLASLNATDRPAMLAGAVIATSPVVLAFLYLQARFFSGRREGTNR
jgi:multiple sugar transport system permease protein